MLDGFKDNEVFQIQKYIILKLTYTENLHLKLLALHYEDHSHGSNGQLANLHMLVAS